jgi:Icc-related predicted phosphoesterase
MKLVCLADTHGRHRRVTNVPYGEILIFAGDFTHVNSDAELPDFDDWLESLPHPHKIVIAGNHDWCFESRPMASMKALTAATYLQDGSHTIGGLKLYGSPWQPRFCNWAFNLDRGEALKKKWAKIPADTDILITHGPPANYGDLTSRGDRMGCQDLADVIKRIKPKVHICGHNHEGYGITNDANTVYINASICTARYAPTNPVIVFDTSLY